MEDVMDLSSPYDSATGLPNDLSYFENDLPLFLATSIRAMKDGLKKWNGEKTILNEM